MNDLKWKKYPCLNDGFICLIDVMGDDSAIVQAARVSYGKDKREYKCHNCSSPNTERPEGDTCFVCKVCGYVSDSSDLNTKERNLIRYLLNHSHTTPFEMVEFKFLVRVPMDCWRQWIRHRTANVNEYSTRYTEAIDSQQTTLPQEWRLQATDNKQGSSGFLEEWPEKGVFEYVDGFGEDYYESPGHYLSDQEKKFHDIAKQMYQERLDAGIAKEQARKDLPLSTYTEAYWKCDLHNIFNFLRLRMDSHAQLEIRTYANAMYEIVKQVCPVACEAFEDYVLHAKKFSRMEMEFLKGLLGETALPSSEWDRSMASNMTDREWKEFQEKLS